MRPRRISLKEMAEQLGVSIATVSRALQNSHEVGESTRHRVQELAKKLNYRPNPFAKSLRQNRQKIIGVVVPNLVTHYYAAVLDGIEDYATKRVENMSPEYLERFIENNSKEKGRSRR